MNEKDEFKLMLDVRDFKKNEIQIKVVKVLVVEGKHGDKEVAGSHGTMSRHFVRKLTIPETCDLEKMKSSLSEGFLSINIPGKSQNAVGNESTVPAAMQCIDSTESQKRTQDFSMETVPNTNNTASLDCTITTVSNDGVEKDRAPLGFITVKNEDLMSPDRTLTASNENHSVEESSIGTAPSERINTTGNDDTAPLVCKSTPDAESLGLHELRECDQDSHNTLSSSNLNKMTPEVENTTSLESATNNGTLVLPDVLPLNEESNADKRKTTEDSAMEIENKRQKIADDVNKTANKEDVLHKKHSPHSKELVLKGLPYDVSERDIISQLKLDGIRCKSVSIIKKKNAPVPRIPVRLLKFSSSVNLSDVYKVKCIHNIMIAWERKRLWN